MTETERVAARDLTRGATVVEGDGTRLVVEYSQRVAGMISAAMRGAVTGDRCRRVWPADRLLDVEAQWWAHVAPAGGFPETLGPWPTQARAEHEAAAAVQCGSWAVTTSPHPPRQTAPPAEIAEERGDAHRERERRAREARR